MARPLRIAFPGALYHVTARGNARQNIFQDDEDRQRFLGVLANKKGSDLVSCMTAELDSLSWLDHYVSNFPGRSIM